MKKTTKKTKLKKVSKIEKKTQSWLSNDVFVKLGILFLVAQILGLFVAKILLLQGVETTSFTEDINDPLNAIFLFVEILIMTGVILFLIKYKKQRNFLWLMEGMAVALTSLIVFSAITLNDYIALLFMVLLLFFRYRYKKNVLIRNVASVISVAGAGSFIGISFGLWVISLFIVILAIYDIVAVFGTKHMVTIGESVIKRNFAFTVSMPTKKHNFELGNGDLIIPLIVACSIMANSTFINKGLVVGLVLAASFVGLCLSIYLVSAKKIAMPALPPQTLLMLIVIGTALLLGL